MNTILLFFIQILITLLIAGLVVGYLRPFLKDSGRLVWDRRPGSILDGLYKHIVNRVAFGDRFGIPPRSNAV